MADETMDVSAMEQMSICIWFVNSNMEVCEEFLGFVKLTKMDVQFVFDVFIPILKGWGLDLTGLVGQGYDGAAVMSGSNNGLQKKVSDAYPKAVYVHCCSHVLNLALAGACTATEANDELTALLTESSDDDDKEEDEDENDDDHGLNKSNRAILRGEKKKTVPKLCPNRWSSRVETLSALMAKYSLVMETFKQIAAQSKGEPRHNAQSYIRLMETPQFIVALVVLIETALGIEITKPQTAVNQCHHANAGNANQTSEDYYRINVYYPFIDHVVEEIETRFKVEDKGLISAQSLVPVYLDRLTDSNKKDLESTLLSVKKTALIQKLSGGNENLLMFLSSRSLKLHATQQRNVMLHFIQ
ncbi:52 kDa repressor of the inhibitor of the kinase-like [Paramuricea clavata]|uniref:52 kDa repressor of the inhibitor of the kinase-like n=1 Tax=Paramuricea clavata TaxID=317549 RepID=A0A7D9DD33_PARCT|nr:52 kDa repressor of the inhibitor of the kinase-like [Paramuricea clavata]